MDQDTLVSTYLRALATADVELVLSLFTDDAVVHSPLYGPTPARDFYPSLFTDTSSAALTLHAVMRGDDVGGQPVLSFFFHFDWRLPSGRPAPFDVVDVAHLAPDGRIAQLRLIYDTVDVRPAFEADTGRPTWRPGSTPA